MAVNFSAVWGWNRHVAGNMRLFLSMEAVYAAMVLWGLYKKQEWGRWQAIAFILANACVGVLSILARDHFNFLVWGPGPLVLLVFLLPFVGPYSQYRS